MQRMCIFIALLSLLALCTFAQPDVPSRVNQHNSEGNVFSNYELLLKANLNALPENSGLVYSDGKLWTHEDAGNSAAIYAINPLNGKVIQTVFVDNFRNVDWEDIAADNDFLYIGDFGNNAGNRTNLKILKIAKSEIKDQETVHVKAESISFSYLDQKTFTPDNQTNFDCEALISEADSLYLFTKDHGDFKTRIYALPKDTGSYLIAPVAELNVAGKVTGADYDWVSNRIILIGYGGFKLNSFLYLLDGSQGNPVFATPQNRIVIGDNFTEWQTEGICFIDSSHLYLSCETTTDVMASLFSIDTAEFLLTGESTKIKMPTGINCFPNPVGNYLEIISGEKIGSIIVRDFRGSVLLNRQINDYKCRLDTKFYKLKTGIVFIEIHADKLSVVKKILINHDMH